MVGSEPLGKQHFHMPINQLCWLISENISYPCIRIDNDAIWIYDYAGIRGSIQELPSQLF